MRIFEILRRIVKPTPGPRPAPVVIRPVRGGAIEPWEDSWPRKKTAADIVRDRLDLLEWVRSQGRD